MEELDFTLQGGEGLMLACTKYAEGASARGITAANIQLLRTSLDYASACNTAQKKAVEKVTNLTDSQNQLMAEGLGLIRKIQNAARSKYGEDNKTTMKEFHVGGPSLTTVKAMIAELKYMKSEATDRKEDLAEGGLEESDIAKSDTIGAKLTSTDALQENAKRVQKAATKTRNQSMKALAKAMRKIRNEAKVVFENQPEVLVEFEPMAEGRGRGGKENPPTPPPNPPEQPKQ